MIEIVFGDSACGGLKMAQYVGKGEYRGGAISIVISKHDGSESTAAEIAAAQKKAEAENRLNWETATPMGGDPGDVFGFHLMLSMGDISQQDFLRNRQKAIEELWSIYPDASSSEEGIDFIGEHRETLKTIDKRASDGEDIRIWYSNQPDELCGLYWFMAELKPLEEQLGAVSVVKLPEYEYGDNNRMVSHLSWGEISPGEWHRYTALAAPTTDVFRRHCAAQWNTLQRENAHLRACLNGKLLSVAESIYDDFICREMEQEDNEFQEAMLIGRVLGKYQLGIGDAWIARRIEKMIGDGKLTIASKPPKDGPSYHCRLRKNHSL